MCRKSGLEVKRRCGWVDLATGLEPRLVWSRKNVALATCPRSYITTESGLMVEEFFVRRRLGGIRFAELSARQVEAFLILEQALEAETRETQTNPRL
jgi:hypothetical protein